MAAAQQCILSTHAVLGLGSNNVHADILRTNSWSREALRELRNSVAWKKITREDKKPGWEKVFFKIRKEIP